MHKSTNPIALLLKGTTMLLLIRVLVTYKESKAATKFLTFAPILMHLLLQRTSIMMWFFTMLFSSVLYNLLQPSLQKYSKTSLSGDLIVSPWMMH
jgi:hypothetical protein